jgi:death-on-curing protein
VPEAIKEPIWVEKREVLAAHARQLSLHGGSTGMRDETLLESALGKPKNIFAYEEAATLARLAASYAFGIARNHAFVDGNKRTALVVCLGFLRFNGMTLIATREDRCLAFLSLAKDGMTEPEMSEWLERYIASLPPAL